LSRPRNESVAIARRIGDLASAGVGLAYLGIVASYLDERVEARARLEEALVLLAGEGGDDEILRANSSWPFSTATTVTRSRPGPASRRWSADDS